MITKLKPTVKSATMVALSFRIPKKLHEQLKRQAAALERSTSWFIVRKLRDVTEAK